MLAGAEKLNRNSPSMSTRQDEVKTFNEEFRDIAGSVANAFENALFQVHA